MAEDSGSVEASIVFEKLLNDYLARQVERGKLPLYLKKLGAMMKDYPILNSLDIDESGSVSLNVHNWDPTVIVRDLSAVFDSLIDIAAFTDGGKRAFEEAKASVESVRKQYEVPFSRLRISDRILRGSLRGSLTTGVDGMDMILDGGIPDGCMVLLLGPPGSEKYHFAFQFLADGLRRGDAGLVTVSSMSIKEAKSRLANLKVNVPAGEAKNLLKYVDWYTHKSKAIVGMEEYGAVFVPSKDISNLDIALMASIDKLEFSPTKRAIFDVITTALGMYNISEVTEFVQRQKSRMHKEGMTSIFIVESGAHDERALSTLKHISDGVIQLTKDEYGGLFVQVLSMGAKFDSNRFPLQLTRRGIAVAGEDMDESGTIAEFCEALDIHRDIARGLVDAGFTDLEKLHGADWNELMEIKGIEEETCRRVLDFLGSVEYSQRVLAKKSEKWLKRGIELADAGEFEKARTNLQRALEIDFGNAAALLELSKVFLKEGDERESRKCYEKARLINPEISAPWLEGEANA
jgi:KaiC/GvpD/RAD55 family RecA-like ATPase